MVDTVEGARDESAELTEDDGPANEEGAPDGIDGDVLPHDGDDGPDVVDAGDVPCPPGDLCGPGEYWDPDYWPPSVGACLPDCRHACANPCPAGQICGCVDIGGYCGFIGWCDCNFDSDCWRLFPDDDLCDGGYYCPVPFSTACSWHGVVTCPAGQECLPETGRCSCATHNDCRYLDFDDDFCNLGSPRCIPATGCDYRPNETWLYLPCPAGRVCDQATGECVPE